jgi:hypothetical protein
VSAPAANPIAAITPRATVRSAEAWLRQEVDSGTAEAFVVIAIQNDGSAPKYGFFGETELRNIYWAHKVIDRLVDE